MLTWQAKGSCQVAGQGILWELVKVSAKLDLSLDLWWHAQIKLNLALVLVKIVVDLLTTTFQVLTPVVKLYQKYNFLKILSPVLIVA